MSGETVRLEYPTPRREETSFVELHGTKIPDPYAWMEDPDSGETKEFVTQQNAVSRPFVMECPVREAIEKKLTRLWDYPKVGVPHKAGSKYFFFKNNGLQNQSVLYTQKDLDSEPEVFLDPNLLSEDGTVSLTKSSFSEDGSIFAYGLSESGSDWFDIRFKKVASGEDYPEVLHKSKYTDITWTHDNKGVFYGCYADHSSEVTGRDTTAHGNHKLFYHRIGTPQSEDVLCVEFPDNPKWLIVSTVTDCGRYLIVTPFQHCQDNLLFFCDLQSLPNGKITSKLELTQIVYKFDSDYEYVTNTDSKCVFRTNKDAHNFSLILIDLNEPELKNWGVLIPEHESDVLEWAACVDGDKLIVCYMSDVKNILQLRDLKTGDFVSSLPLEMGSVVGYSGEKKHSELFYKFSSMITPGIIYRVDFSAKPYEAKVFSETKLEGFDPSLYHVEQVFYNSKDGTRIPMFIASKKNTPKDGNTPCFLYGYGGFNISLTPSFSISHLFFIQHFGYMAVANIRGGGEYGKSWHNAGRLFKKQNTFTDFACAAEFLCKEGYTSKEKLAIRGGSSGGLLIGACVNQNPGLFGAAIAHAGVMDMLKYHKFTIGHAWISDFGDPEEKDQFENNLKYSPLHNVRVPEGDVQYPAVLLTAADHDDRVVPSHSLKFIAELQNVLGKIPKQVNPLLIRVDTKAGHGIGKPTSKAIEEITDAFCFLVQVLGYQLK